MMIEHGLAVEGVEIAVGRKTLCPEESLNAVAELLLLWGLSPPRPIHRPVARRAPRVVAEDRRLRKLSRMRCAVEIGIGGGESGLRICRLQEECATGGRGLRPEGAVFGGSPARPEFVKSGEVVGGIGEV